MGNGFKLKERRCSPCLLEKLAAREKEEWECLEKKSTAERTSQEFSQHLQGFLRLKKWIRPAMSLLLSYQPYACSVATVSPPHGYPDKPTFYISTHVSSSTLPHRPLACSLYSSNTGTSPTPVTFQQPEPPKQQVIWDSACYGHRGNHPSGRLCVTLQALHILSVLSDATGALFPAEVLFNGDYLFSSAITSSYHLHLLVYFLKFHFPFTVPWMLAPAFFQNYRILALWELSSSTQLPFFFFHIFWCFMTFSNIFMHLRCCSFSSMFLMFLIFTIRLFTFLACSCNLLAFDFSSYLSLHLISLFAQFTPIKYFWFTALFGKAACLPGERLRHEGVG